VRDCLSPICVAQNTNPGPITITTAQVITSDQKS